MMGTPLTVPEGMRLTAIASRVEEVTEGRISADDFIAAAQAPRWAEEFAFVRDAGEGSLEGMLFPATYSVIETTTADDLVRAMLNKFQAEMKGLDPTYAYDQGLTWYEWLTLASIIQAESAAGDEATVASVFYNRMAQDMPLQSDATSAYSVGGVPSAEDLANYDDPYNTYSYERLGVCIPTPIGNPGLAAMEAACHPESTEYLYFFAYLDAAGDMHTIFSRTYEEHQQAIEDHS